MTQQRPAQLLLWMITGAVAAALGAFGHMGALGSYILTTVLTLAFFPLFLRYAMARLNARSSHRKPVPQGGGAALILAVAAVALVFTPMIGLALVPERTFVLAVLGALIALGLIGAVDDIRPLPASLRFGMQAVVVLTAVLLLPAGWRVLPVLPSVLEQALLVFGLLWFINLTNFIDGIDGITIAGFLPMAACIGWLLPESSWLSIIAFALAGGLLAFAVFNWPTAKLMLGDVGSLPIGFLGGCLLIVLAVKVSLAAAIILPMYHVLDATWTLLARLSRREKVWEAHRQHAYQNAVDSGLSHLTVSGLVMGLNLCLVGLAVFAAKATLFGQGIAVMIAASLTAALFLWLRARSR